MQPFDALTLKAVLQEAKPLLLNRKVEKIHQLARDEIIVTLRSRGAISHLLISAQAAFGRACLVKMPVPAKKLNVPTFCALLRKHLTGAMLVRVEQLAGERIVDFTFACADEIGNTSQKVLSAEIMGRHSNLILWDKGNASIIACSHQVTREMSRQRELAQGLRYTRPPQQERPNLFKVDEQEFCARFTECGDLNAPLPLEQRLLDAFTGLGRHLAEELVASVTACDYSRLDQLPPHELASLLWQKVQLLQQVQEFRPAMRKDQQRYTVLSWFADAGDASLWQAYPSVNDLVEEYFHAQELRERFQQLKDRLTSELKGEREKVASRLEIASEHLSSEDELSKQKKYGDLILAHLSELEPGQTELVCNDLYAGPGEQLVIPLNPNLSPAQNAQTYYRHFSKLRARRHTASMAQNDATTRLSVVDGHIQAIAKAETIDDLERIRDSLAGGKLQQRITSSPPPYGHKKTKIQFLNVLSSDGWTIYVGRNRQENDQLISKVAQPNDIWMHVLGQGGAHVLIRVPSTKQMPPVRTLHEAAQLAARLSKAGLAGKVRVVYTHCRHLRKLGQDKKGMVRYEMEKTLEVDTAGPMPEPLKRLFARRSGHLR